MITYLHTDSNQREVELTGPDETVGDLYVLGMSDMNPISVRTRIRSSDGQMRCIYTSTFLQRYVHPWAIHHRASPPNLPIAVDGSTTSNGEVFDIAEEYPVPGNPAIPILLVPRRFEWASKVHRLEEITLVLGWLTQVVATDVEGESVAIAHSRGGRRESKEIYTHIGVEGFLPRSFRRLS
ncbi:hypothetical protein BHE74_00058078 [Ensete ventricosum]|nr:hypothetical protein BHE74_00058078 [Ensete ventricosum]